MVNREWHARSMEETLAAFKTVPRDGLDAGEAAARLAQWGPNLLQEAGGFSPWRVLAAQFQDFMVLVLLAATAISGLLGEYLDALTILAIVVVNAVLGFFQEYRAERSLEALREMSIPEARVRREGQTLKVPAAEVVPGDILILESGDRVAADARLLEAYSLEAEEALLTGESLPVAKSVATLSGPVPLGERRNMVYTGTAITRGRGVALVVATGMGTEMGGIANLLQGIPREETPLQRQLAYLGKVLVGACLATVAVVVATGLARGEPLFQMFFTGVSLAVAAIPEGLPAVVTVSLSLGVQRMARRRAVVRRLPAVETLGCATYICSDKTGTLTKNEMTVRRIYCGGRLLTVEGEGSPSLGAFRQGEHLIEPQGDADLTLLLEAAVVCNNASLVQPRRTAKGVSWQAEGDPTEAALLVAAAKAGITAAQLEEKYQRVAEAPFESGRKRMSTVCQVGDRRLLFTKGAPDVVLERCTNQRRQGVSVPLKEAERRELQRLCGHLGGEALRVLALAYRPLAANEDLEQPERLEQGLTFLGLSALQDPPRPEVKRALEVGRRAGLKTMMITGDHPATARAVAVELGLLDEGRHLVTGRELDSVSDAELERRVEEIAVCARVSPEHKLRLVRALKKRGQVVAMTGDGVNDAPAVSEADIGVAMGVAGTDVTREAAAMVLADDNYATIVAAIEEGRAIYDNIRKFIRYLLSCNAGEVLTMFLAALAGLPLPLVPIQLLWVNLVTDGLPAIALGLEPPDPDVMTQPPRNARESVFARGLGLKIIALGSYLGVATPLVFSASLFWGGDLATARTVAFATLVFSQLAYVFECKSERHTPFEAGFFGNAWLLGAVALSTLMQLAVIYLPPLQTVFHTVALDGGDWLLVLLVSCGRLLWQGLAHYLLAPVQRRFLWARY